MSCLSQMRRNSSILALKPDGSCRYTTLLKNTRIVLKPSSSAQPSSVSMSSGDQLSLLHISIWLTALEGM